MPQSKMIDAGCEIVVKTMPTHVTVYAWGDNKDKPCDEWWFDFATSGEADHIGPQIEAFIKHLRGEQHAT